MSNIFNTFQKLVPVTVLVPPKDTNRLIRFAAELSSADGRKKVERITAEQLRAILNYDPLSGVFTNRADRAYDSRAGDVVGTMNKKRVYIGLFGRKYSAHTLAWLYVYGHYPSRSLDHINGDPADNRIANLRDVSHLVNMQNKRRASKNNKTGLLGVTSRKNLPGFIAQIGVGGKIKYLGRFDTAVEAHAAYVQAKRNLHEGCTI